MSFDDLYNNFKIVKQEVKRTVTTSSSSSSQHMAFVSSPGSTNKADTANIQVSTVSTPVSTASTHVNTANLSDATVYAFLANHPNGSQLVHEDLEQIHEDDLEEMDLKWQLALLSMRARRYYQRTGKKITINGSDTAGYDKSKVECFNCHKMGHFARECRGPRNQESRPRNQDSSKRTVNVEETSSKAMVAIDGAGFDWIFMADEEVPTNMALMDFLDSEVYNDKTCSNTCLKSFETLKTQYDNLRIEFNKSEFDLATYKRGLASVEEQLVFYKKNEVMFCEQIVVLKRDITYKDSDISVLKCELEKLKKEKESNKLKINKFENASKSLFAPLTIDLSNSGLEEFQRPKFEGYGPKTSKSVYVDTSNEVKKTPYAPLVEELVSKKEKQTVFPTKIELVKQQEKPARKPVNFDHVQANCNYHQRERVVFGNNYTRVNYNYSAQKAHPSAQRNMFPKAVLMKNGLKPLNTARPVNTAHHKTTVYSARPISHSSKPAQSTGKVNTARPKGVNIARPKGVNTARPTSTIVNVVRANQGHPQKEDQGYVDNECSRHMTGNISYLSDFKEFNGGYVTFGGGANGGKIIGKGTLKTGKLDFEDVYFVKELKFNLFSVSQMCDKKNSVLFIDAACFVLSPNFKLPDKSQVLLKSPRKNNMYSVDMKNIVPKESLTCLVSNESMFWHRRLGHINFKTINKLVKDNLVRGLPVKRFENYQTYVACLKGKQHKASCKSKLQNFITHPLFMLHMDLFGPTFVSSLMNKKYCLVVTDDYSRFTWVFFLASKDETSGILKNFITEIENLVDKKVKIIRCDNGTEFKNRVMNEFCGKKSIKREYSVARTPQQNGVAERRNRTLIEAARTMLADSKLPTTFWAEAVNTACYVQNRIIIVKSHNKTPYELFRGRTPALSFMRPFGCHVTILNTLEHLGKFDGKSDDGFFVGYSLTSKAFRVYNIRTRKVEENLHIRFLEDKPIVTGYGPKWLFDIDSLTKSMNYVPVVAGTNSNDFAGSEESNGEGHSSKETKSSQDYIVMPLWKDGLLFDSSSKNSSDGEPQPSSYAEKKDDEGISKASGVDDQERPESSTLNINTVGPSINTASANFKTDSLNINIVSPTVITTRSNRPHYVSDMFSLGDNATHEATHADLFGDETGLDMSNITTTYQVPTTPNTRIHKVHSLDHVIGDIQFGVQTRGMTKNTNEHGFISDVYEGKTHEDPNTCLFACFLSQEEPKRIAKALSNPAWVEALQEDLLQFKLQKVWIIVDLPKDPDYPNKVYKVVKAMYGLHQALRAWYETLAKYLLDNGFQRGKIDQNLFIKKQKGDILLVQVYVDDIIFGSTKKELCTEFEKLMHDKFQMSSMRELNFFLDVRTASTPMDTEKPLLKDSDGDDVDVHLYRSMIGSLMYLTSSRPDIMFAVCACARFQVTPKVSHSHAVKRIFRYLKSQPKLGLWYPRDSPFDLVAYSDSDYAAASLDRKSTTGGCHQKSSLAVQEANCGCHLLY
ncbi:putative ribonuclease H-like domain-containing protein [Tanacetum coccineum]